MVYEIFSGRTWLESTLRKLTNNVLLHISTEALSKRLHDMLREHFSSLTQLQ